MQKLQTRKTQVIERIVRTKAGELVRATFYIVECSGHIVQVKFLKAVPIAFTEAECVTKDCVALPAPIEQAIFEIVKSIKIDSLFTPSFNLDFFNNQLARAPSLIA